MKVFQWIASKRRQRVAFKETMTIRRILDDHEKLVRIKVHEPCR